MSLCNTSIVLTRCANYAISVDEDALKVAGQIRTLNRHSTYVCDFGDDPIQIMKNATIFAKNTADDDVTNFVGQYYDQLCAPTATEPVVITLSERYAQYTGEIRNEAKSIAQKTVEFVENETPEEASADAKDRLAKYHKKVLVPAVRMSIIGWGRVLTKIA